MHGLLATFSREMRAYFFSPLAYVVLTFFLLINGSVFALIVSFLNDPRAAGSTTPLKLFFGDTLFFWLVMLFVTPILTMRLISEERRSGTIESLMTAPISEAQVVVGKFLAALGFFLFLWLPTFVYVVIIARHSAIDYGPILSGYLSILGIGSVFIAVGLFASSFTKNQIVAAIITFAFLIFFFAIAFLDGLTNDAMWKEVLSYLNLIQHTDDFSNGIIDTRRLVYYLSTTVLFLFLTTHALAAKKWR